MNSRLTEQAAAQHTAELLSAGHPHRRTAAGRRDRRAAGPVRAATRPIRRRTGWALISVGLWLASDGR
jgi:hypothetical protein